MNSLNIRNKIWWLSLRILGKCKVTSHESTRQNLIYFCRIDVKLWCFGRILSMRWSVQLEHLYSFIHICYLLDYYLRHDLRSPGSVSYDIVKTYWKLPWKSLFFSHGIQNELYYSCSLEICEVVRFKCVELVYLG